MQTDTSSNFKDMISGQHPNFTLLCLDVCRGFSGHCETLQRVVRCKLYSDNRELPDPVLVVGPVAVVSVGAGAGLQLGQAPRPHRHAHGAHVAVRLPTGKLFINTVFREWHYAFKSKYRESLAEPVNDYRAMSMTNVGYYFMYKIK